MRTKPLGAIAAGIFFITFLPGTLARADTFTLVATNGVGATFEVPSNTVAQIVSSYGPCGDAASRIRIIAEGGEAIYYLNLGGINFARNFNNSGFPVPPPTIAGPATIALTNGCDGSEIIQLAFCTIQTFPVRSVTASPSTALVVPNDGGGPLTIIMESSVDLLHWAPAQPGVYSATTATNRFFRIRAER